MWRNGDVVRGSMRTLGVSLSFILLLSATMLGNAGDARASGTWTVGSLTNNMVDDVSPRLSSTHIAWAQRSGFDWQIKLRPLSGEAALTVARLPYGDPDIPPDVHIAGDYVVAASRGDDAWYVYQISTGSLDVHRIASGTGMTVHSVEAFDGERVVLVFDDGDLDVSVYRISDGAWTKITDDDTGDDDEVRLDRGRLVWEHTTPVTWVSVDRSVVFRDLASSSNQTIATRRYTSIYTAGTGPQISRDWLGYRAASGRIPLYRLADGVTVEPGVSAAGWARWLLTDDFAFWLEEPVPGAGTDLYAFDLSTLETIRLTEDTAYEQILGGDNGRLVYARRAAASDVPQDVFVIDLDDVPRMPRFLAANLLAPSTGFEPFSILGDLIAGTVFDGHDNEIAWAKWEEDEVPAFVDVPPGHPYFEAVSGLAARGIVSGYDSATFGVNDPVRRQQFAKMIVGTVGLTPVEADFPHPDVPFTDLGEDDPADLYPHEYVSLCARNGITVGKTPTTFDPWANITRAQVITMVVRAVDHLAPGTLDDPPTGWTGAVPADDPIHGANIRRAEFNGLLSGIQAPGGSLSAWVPEANATRGEVAQVLWKVLGKLE